MSLSADKAGTPAGSSYLDRIPDGFHNCVLWRFLFLTIVVLVGELGVGMGPLAPQGGRPQPRYSSQFLTITGECGTGPFCVSAPPNSFHVASYVYT